MAFGYMDPLPTLGVHSDNRGPWHGYVRSSDFPLSEGQINGVDVAFGLAPTISYDTLVGGLGLAPGVYDLTLNLRVPVFGEDMAVTTIEIIPAPASILLVIIMGGLRFVRRR